MLNRAGWIGGFRKRRVGVGLVSSSDVVQPTPAAAEYQYGTHELAIKGSKEAGYGVAFGSFLALMSVAVLQHKGHFTGTEPQPVGYQQSSVNPASPALFATAAQSPVIKSILGQGQENLTQTGSATYQLQQSQRPIFDAVLTFPQEIQQQVQPSVFTITAAKGLQTPLMVSWLQTWPQENQQQPPSAAYSFPPPSQVPNAPPLGPALLTQAEWPQLGQSFVRTTNIALALAAPAPRSAILTQAEQPIPSPSWSIVITPLIPPAQTPPNRPWVQSWPVQTMLYEVNQSVVKVPTAALIPSVTPPPVTGLHQVNMSVSFGIGLNWMGTRI